MEALTFCVILLIGGIADLAWKVFEGRKQTKAITNILSFWEKTNLSEPALRAEIGRIDGGRLTSFNSNDFVRACKEVGAKSIEFRYILTCLHLRSLCKSLRMDTFEDRRMAYDAEEKVLLAAQDQLALWKRERGLE